MAGRRGRAERDEREWPPRLRHADARRGDVDVGYELRVLTYNIRDGGGDRISLIADIVRSQAPDAVALVEATDNVNAAELARQLGMELVLGTAASGFHIAWLTRLPIRQSANHASAALSKTLLEIEVDTLDAPVRLFAAHLASRHDLQHSPAEEIRSILATLVPLGDRPHALVGDFNALAATDEVGEPPTGVIPRGEAVSGAPREALSALSDAGYVDCYQRLHSEPGYTYPADMPWLRLDYVFASSSLARRLVACDRGTGGLTASASDHLPVWAEFAGYDSSA